MNKPLNEDAFKKGVVHKDMGSAVFIDVTSTRPALTELPLAKEHDLMVEKRQDEPAYAKLNGAILNRAKLYDPNSQEKNRYGNKITLVDEGNSKSEY